MSKLPYPRLPELIAPFPRLPKHVYKLEVVEYFVPLPLPVFITYPFFSSIPNSFNVLFLPNPAALAI